MAEKAKILEDTHVVAVGRNDKRVIVKAHIDWPQEFLDLVGSIDEDLPRYPQESITELKDPFE